MQNSRIWPKIVVFMVLSLGLMLTISLPWGAILGTAPRLTLLEGEEYLMDLGTPFNLHIKGSREGILQVNDEDLCPQGNSLQGPLFFKALQLGNVILDFKLFGVIPLRQVEVNVLPEKELMPGGHSIGIKIKAEGVMVVGFNLIETRDDHLLSPAQEAGIMVGDVILEINGQTVSDLMAAAKQIQEGSGHDRPLHLKILRGRQPMEFRVRPQFCREQGDYRIGLYIKDSAAGVGTMTFYDPASGIFGALGHVIADAETHAPMEIGQGQIVRADIVNIRTARRGFPGEKNGVFVEGEDILGSIDKNTHTGIYGRLDSIDNHPLYPEPLPIGLSQDVQEGPATILTVVEGNTIEEFDIEIQKVNSPRSRNQKDIVIRITDEKLLEHSGGIVQGMSGSPILQGNRIVGAVTHVFVNEPERGYGIFLESMLLDSGLLEASEASNFFFKIFKKICIIERNI